MTVFSIHMIHLWWPIILSYSMYCYLCFYIYLFIIISSNLLGMFFLNNCQIYRLCKKRKDLMSYDDCKVSLIVSRVILNTIAQLSKFKWSLSLVPVSWRDLCLPVKALFVTNGINFHKDCGIYIKRSPWKN